MFRTTFNYFQLVVYFWHFNLYDWIIVDDFVEFFLHSLVVVGWFNFNDLDRKFCMNSISNHTIKNKNYFRDLLF